MEGHLLARSLSPLFLNGTLYSQCDGDGDGGEASLLLYYALLYSGRMNSYELSACYELSSFGVAELNYLDLSLHVPSVTVK